MKFTVISIDGSADVYVAGPDGNIFADAGVVRLCGSAEEANALTLQNVQNAKRIAACLNACEGLHTKVVQTIAAFGGMSQDTAVAAVMHERDAFAREVDEANERVAAVTDQRDQLLAALEKASEYIGNQKVPTCTHSNGMTHLLGTINIKEYLRISETINAAIAAAKGGAA